MKNGDFVSVHFDSGCQIGRFISDEGDTVSVSLGTITGETIVMTDIPKQMVTLHVAIH